jgi:hypothetical protein
LKKHIFFLSFLIAISGVFFVPIVFAESSNNDVKYFFDISKISMFAGPYTRLCFINNTLVTGMGGGGIICWDHRYYIYGQMTSYSANVPNNSNKEMELVNYGATLGYIFFPLNKVHFSIGIQFASNTITFRESNGLKDNQNVTFFSIAPETNVEINVLEYLRIYLGAGWHFAITDDDYLDINRETLSGFSINFGFLMGKF